MGTGVISGTLEAPAENKTAEHLGSSVISLAFSFAGSDSRLARIHRVTVTGKPRLRAQRGRTSVN
jgi:hypothetical protein